MKKVLLSMACIASVAAANAASNPVTIKSGWNADVVCEEVMAETKDWHANPWMDGHHSQFLVNGNTLMGPITCGLPADGKITAEKSGNVYQFGDYTKNNALFLTHGYESGKTYTFPTVGSGTLEFATPVAADKIGVMGSVTNCEKKMTVDFTIKFNYEDGTSSEGTASIRDWGDGSNTDYIYKCDGRYRATANSNPEIKGGNYFFRINEAEVACENTKKIKSITITNNDTEADNWGHRMLNIYGVTAITGTNAIEDVVVESAEVEAIYNLNGVKLNDLNDGINIVKYTNGTVKKVRK